MKIGIYAGSWQPKSGGAFSFFETIYNGLLKQTDIHTYYFFYEGNFTFTDSAQLKYISLNSNSIQEANIVKISVKTRIKNLIKKLPVFKLLYFELNKLKKQNSELSNKIQNLSYEQQKYFDYNNILNITAIEYKIELIWFMTPNYQPVQCPYIYTLWDLAHLNHPYFPEVNYSGWTWEKREELYLNVLRKSTFIIVGTETGKNEVIKYYNVNPNKIKVIPFPTTISEQNQSFEEDKAIKNYIFYPAQFWPHKNHICILYALKILHEKYNLKIKCVFTGSDMGNESYIKQKVSELKLEEFIEFKGFVSKESLILLYKNALALVFPTFFGPDNLPPIEAFSLGCPVIVSDGDGAREQMKTGALFFNPTDEGQLALNIKRIYDDVNLRELLIKNGYSIANEYTTENYFFLFNELLEEFIKMRRCWDSDNLYMHS